MTEEHKSLNRFLLKSYGKTLTNKAKFRLVWSEDIFEARRGEFNEFYGKIFLRTVVGVREVKKYNYIINRYILEGFVDSDLSCNGEVPEARSGDYVPIWVFEDSKGNPLPVTQKVLTFLVASVQGRVKKDKEISEKEAEEKEIQAQYESFDDHPMDFCTHGVNRNSIAYTSDLKEKECLSKVQ